ncbi:MAG: glycosyltransferase [Planctomycetes bacterium]|nr:glycosyltransferase [Planctomycetota bacterium]
MIDSNTTPRIVLAHDWLVGLRGGEFVLDRLARLFGPTDLYTLVCNGIPLTDAITACDIKTSHLQMLPGASGRMRRQYLPLMPWAVSRIKVEPCDLVISTSSAVMKSIRPPQGTPHICYCHSPARYIWAQTDEYTTGSGGAWRKAGLNLVAPAFKKWDKSTADRVTKFLANSNHTAKRINECFDREAEVVYPPVRTNWFTVDENVKREDWLLVVAALEPYKRTDLVIQAATKAGIKLKVAGSGSQFDALKAQAGTGDNVQMLGHVDELELLDLYRKAKALVFPQVEDFGIIAVEAQATGCPVIAFADGGATETVANDTGVFFNEPNVESLLGAIEVLGSVKIDPNACRTNAERFAEKVFDEAVLKHVEEIFRDFKGK